MTIDIDKLLELASRATPGPWFKGRSMNPYAVWTDKLMKGDAINCFKLEDAQFVEMANPQTITQLCLEFKEMEAKYNFMKDSAWKNGEDRDLFEKRYLHACREIKELREMLGMARKSMVEICYTRDSGNCDCTTCRSITQIDESGLLK